MSRLIATKNKEIGFPPALIYQPLSYYAHLNALDDVELHGLAIADRSEVFFRVVLHDRRLMHENFFLSVVPITMERLDF